jgi:formylglycine-generating enzyme required for sulfatase activity
MESINFSIIPSGTFTFGFLEGWQAGMPLTERDIARYISILKKATERKLAIKQKQAAEGKTESKEKEDGDIKSSPALPDCGPARLLSVKRFGLSRDLVTVAQWKEYCTAVRKELPKTPPWGARDNHPVVNVTWLELAGQSDRLNFCQWYSNKYGVSARLPSEEEWEYALGGGSRQYELGLPYGLMASATWTSVGTKRMETAPVSRREFIHENPLGVRDMIGNVWEWTSSLYVGYPDRTGYPREISGETAGKSRVLRGGAFNTENPDYLRKWYRNRAPRNEWRYTFDLRWAF